MNIGYIEGETCNRDGCQGIIKERPVDNCSCHITPPCSACTEPKGYCEICGWDARDDSPETENNQAAPVFVYDIFRVKKFEDLDRTKIDWIVQLHTHFSMICKGVYPEGTTKEQVEEKVKGTFGGRFKSFGNGQFEYVAYTD